MCLHVALADLRPDQPRVEPAVEGHVTTEQCLEGRGEDLDYVTGQKEGLVEGEEDEDDVQRHSGHQDNHSYPAEPHTGLRPGEGTGANIEYCTCTCTCW